MAESSLEKNYGAAFVAYRARELRIKKKEEPQPFGTDKAKGPRSNEKAICRFVTRGALAQIGQIWPICARAR